MPRVSIVMPVYNGEEYLCEAIDSIIAQSFKDWEFIIINEYGSNEKTSEILYKYTSQDKRIKVIQNDTKLGISASLNIGLKNAKGEYIARMDSDDISLPQRIEKQVAYMDLYPEIAMCGTKVEVFGDKKFDWYVEINPNQITTDILFYSPCVHPTVMFRSSVLREYSLKYNESYRATEDYDLFSRICQTHKVSNVDEVLFRYRLMNANATFRNNNIGIQIYSEIIARQFKNIGLNFSQNEIDLLSPHVSLKNLSGKDVLTKFQELDWLLKQIYLANSKVKKYDSIYLTHTLHKRFEEAYRSIDWYCKNYKKDKVDEIYNHSIFRHSSFSGNYLEGNKRITPIITVLMPTYNSEKYVMDTIDSVLKQSFFDFEFIIINEFGSNDKTVDCIQSFSDPRIRLLQNESKLGLAESLNKGIKAARGKYIARIDADDLSHSDRFEKQVRYMENHPDCGVCGSWQHHWGIDMEWIHKGPIDHDQIKASLIYRCELCHSTLMLRKSFFIENNLFYEPKYFAEDYELWTRAVFLFKFHNIPEILGEYRVGEENITSKKLQELSRESGEITAQNLKQHLNIYVPKEHVKYLSSWIHEFNHTIDPITKRKHLKIEKQILRKIWYQNQKLKIYNDDCLLSVINQRWKWITNDWVFGTEQKEIQSIDELFKNKYSLIKRICNKAKRYGFKDLLKKILMPLYRPFKHRVCDRFDQLRQQIWDVDGHICDNSNSIQKKISLLEETIKLQNQKLESVILALENYNAQINDTIVEQNRKIETFENNVSDLYQELCKTVPSINKTIERSEKLINQTVDSRIWKAEQNINQTMDARIWKAEQNINQTTDTRIWNAEKLINQTMDSRVWKTEQNLENQEEKLREETHRHIDFTYRDIMIAMERQKSYLPYKSVNLITDYPVAYKSLDHLYPHGTIRDNTRYPRFVKKCEELLGRENGLAFLDLGCSGGGMVLDAALRGHLSIGLEGSDCSAKELRAEWRLLGDRLKTCDITKPFRLEQADGMIQKFDIITAWEVMEHIAENDLPQLFCNIQEHLSDDGYFIASIANWDDIDPKTGVNWHVTVHPYDWWKARFEQAGFVLCFDLLQPIDLARGGYNPPHCYETPSTEEIDETKTFHIVVQKK